MKKMHFTKRQKLVLFDIDGTLIRSKKSVGHFTHGFKKVFGKSIEIDFAIFYGNIDRKIIVDIGKQIGLKDSYVRLKLDEVYSAMYEFYSKKVTTLNAREYYEFLNDAIKLAKQLDFQVHTGLLTGNYEGIGRYKMELIGLDSQLKFGLFGHEAENRIELARQTFKRARDFFGIKFRPEQIIIIGDTPDDILCAQSINARSIAVATGKSTLLQLQKSKPDLAVETLIDERVIPFILK